MTAMAVQVLGILMNKCCSTGDNKCSWDWIEIPTSLQVYCLRDLKFGHLCYMVLSAILLQDIFPDPEIICKYLNLQQFDACSWFLELVMRALDGTEIHPVHIAKVVNKSVPATRRELAYSLRF